MAKNNNLTDFLTDVADAIREKKGTSDLINPQDFSAEIASIKTTGSSHKDCNFFDPHGNIIYSFTAEEAMNLTELPVPPDYTNKGLIFESYTHTLEDIHSAGGILDLGCYYYTDDNSLRYTIEIISSTEVVLHFTSEVTIDWGDGNLSDTYTSILHDSYESFAAYQYIHNYNPGKYIIKCKADDITPGMRNYASYNGKYQAIQPQECLYEIAIPKESTVRFISDSTRVYSNLNVIYHPNVKFYSTNNTTTMYYFQACNLSFAIFKNLPEHNDIYGANPLKNVVIVDDDKYIYKKLASIPLDNVCLSNKFDSLYFSNNNIFIKKIRIPKNLKWSNSQRYGVFGTRATQNIFLREIGTLTDKFKDVYINAPYVKKIKFDNTISGINGSYFISNIEILDISESTSVVPLTSLFNISYFKILVKKELLEEYKTATNWSNYADYFIGV